MFKVEHRTNIIRIQRGCLTLWLTMEEANALRRDLAAAMTFGWTLGQDEPRPAGANGVVDRKYWRAYDYDTYQEQNP